MQKNKFDIAFICATSRLYGEMLIEVVFICPCNATVHERVLRTCDDFVWPVDTTFLGRLIIDVEFLDLKIHPLNVSL